MTFNSKEFTEVLLGVILFECASQPKNKYTFRELACAFYNARLLLRFDSNLNSSSSHVYIQEHKLYTTQGLIQYVHSLHRGNNGYFPCSTSHIRKVQCHSFDTNNASYDDEFVYLRACSSTEVDNFFSNYAEKVPSVFHNYIAAVVEHLRDCCWDEHRGSGGVGVVLSSLAGTLGVAKYSMEHNAHERLRRRQYLPDKIAQQTSFLQRFQVAQMGREYRERVRLEREYRERERLERDVRLMQKKKEEAKRMKKEEVRRVQKEKEDQERERILKDMRRMQKEKEDQEQERILKDMRRMRIIEGYKANQQRLHQQQLQHIDAPHLADINLYLNELKLQVATADTRRNVDTLRQTLEKTLRTYPRFRNAEVSLFGSFESGLSTLTSDADFTVSNLVGLTIEPIHDLAQALQLSGYGPIKTVADARVPIVTFTGQGIRCDMNINHPMGVFNSQLIHAYQKIDTRFLGIWFGLRSLADKHGILNGKTQYLTSYALTMMLIVFLQDVTSPPILPRLQQQSTYKLTTRIIDGYHCAYDKDARNYSELAAKNTKTHGELLKEFCQYFGHTFNYATQEVNPRLGVIRNRSVKPPPRTLTDSRLKEWPICVLDPFITDRNVAGNCRGINVAVIQRCFRTVHDALVKDDIKKAFKV